MLTKSLNLANSLENGLLNCFKRFWKIWVILGSILEFKVRVELQHDVEIKWISNVWLFYQTIEISFNNLLSQSWIYRHGWNIYVLAWRLSRLFYSEFTWCPVWPFFKWCRRSSEIFWKIQNKMYWYHDWNQARLLFEEAFEWYVVIWLHKVFNLQEWFQVFFSGIFIVTYIIVRVLDSYLK